METDVESAIDVVCKAIDGVSEDFNKPDNNKDFMSYMALSGGIENSVRDRLAYHIFRNGKKNKSRLLGLKEKDRLDLLVVEVDAACDDKSCTWVRAKFVVELKTRLPDEIYLEAENKNSINYQLNSDADKIPGKICKYYGGNSKVWTERLRGGGDCLSVPVLWLFVFPIPKSGYSEGNDIELLISKKYRSQYRKVCSTGYDKVLDELTKKISSITSGEKSRFGYKGGGWLLGDGNVLGVGVGIRYELFYQRQVIEFKL